MKNTKTQAGGSQKSSQVEDTYAVAAFMAKYEVTSGEAQTIIKRYGPGRKKLDAYMTSRNL